MPLDPARRVFVGVVAFLAAVGDAEAAPFALGITRTRNCVVIQVTTRPHSREATENSYRPLSRELESAPFELVVSIVTNTDEDWAFGSGRAQLLSGELASGRSTTEKSR